MFDGDSANYASAQLTSKLQENGRYQYIYTSDATFAYDEEIPQLAIYTVNDPLAGAIKPDPKPEPEPDEPANDAIAVDSAAYNTLFGTIASSYAGTSEEWKALELAAAGRVSSVDVATLVANAKAANGSPETTNLQRFILALTAVGKTEEAAVSRRCAQCSTRTAVSAHPGTRPMVPSTSALRPASWSPCAPWARIRRHPWSPKAARRR